MVSRLKSLRRSNRSRIGRSTSSGKILRIIGIVLALVVLSGGGFWYYWTNRGQAQIEGRVTVTSLNQRVEITRDANGVPKIKAATDLDGYRALGFVHAQDRFFQMDLMRHLGSGRLSEWVGRDGLESDQLFRALQLRRVAEANFNSLSPEAKAAMTAYSQGVNAVILAKKFSFPPEYLLLPSGRPEEWTPVDSLLWGKVMGVFLGSNIRSEIRRARLITNLPETYYKELFPDEAGQDLVTMASLGQNHITPQKLVSDLTRILDRLPKRVASGGASNQWILAAHRTDTGAPIMANDPHLGLAYPGSWYLIQMETPNLRLTGATAPGVPFMVLGRNDSIAWSLTTTQADSQDIFVEKLTANQPGFYDTPDGPKPIRAHDEVIKVRRSQPQTLTVRETRHGTVISNIWPGTQSLVGSDTIMALQSTFLSENDRSYETFFRLATANSWESFRAAVSNFGGPPHNFGYADRNGHIGMITAGQMPIRRSGDGLLPTAGWTGQTDWVGYIPFDKWPSRFNPPSGVLINANNKVIGDDYPYLISKEWFEDYRARRIAEKIASQPRHSLADTIALQNDVESLAAREMLPRLLAAASPTAPISPEADFAKRMLQSWNHRMERERPEPLIFAAWIRHLKLRLFKPVYGIIAVGFGQDKGDLWTPSLSTVARIIARDSVWCGIQPTAAIAPTPTNCDEQINGALEDALAELRHDYGNDPLRWKWGEAHHVKFAHPIFDRIPILRNRLELSLAASGGADTVQFLTYPMLGHSIAEEASPYYSNYGSEYRAVYDLARPMGVRMVAAPGQSGQAWSKYADRLLSHWGWGDLVNYSANTESDRLTEKHVLELIP
ncbi:MAG: penicillin acylase family protein [Candidatus Pacebacteria bacterium]|nr:penicillin acylase family protein [Candidatus Paceibacterota bacterium]